MSLDNVVQQMLSGFIKGGPRLIIVAVALFIFMPSLFFVVLYLVVSVLKVLIEAIIGYLLALLGITFLFSLAPIFVCLALFRATSSYFQTWLQYMASFTLQMLVVFAFIVIMIMCNIFGFFSQVGTLVRNYDYVFSFGFIHIPIPVSSLCKVRRDGENERTGTIKYFTYRTDTSALDEDGNKTHLTDSYTDQPFAGFPRCIPKYNVIDALTPGGRRPPGFSIEEQEAILEEIDVSYFKSTPGHENPLGKNFESDKVEKLLEIIEKENKKLILPFFKMLGTTDLISFLMIRFMVVIVLTYLLDKFMKKIPHMATMLGGTKYQGRMMGGEEDREDMPGIQDTRDTLGLKTGFERFRLEGMDRSGNPVTDAPQRFSRGILGMASGMGAGMLEKSVRRSRGLGRNWKSAVNIGTADRAALRIEGVASQARKARPGGRRPPPTRQAYVPKSRRR